MKRQAVFFTGRSRVEVREETVPAPGSGEVLVATRCSAISAGTELLFFRGEAPRTVPVDETHSSLAGSLEYPLKYGYAAVGQVIGVGRGVRPEWKGRHVFAFNPHETHFIANVKDVTPLRDELSPDEAVFFPNMETAVMLVADGAPLIGERVVVFGQGVVGLLVTSLLARFPLQALVTLDRYPIRRETSLQFGGQASIDPAPSDAHEAVLALLSAGGTHAGADLAFELSGHPGALDAAIAVTGFHGRVVIGSWYGTKHVELDLGGRFHRSRIRLIASQVSRINPELSGRFDKARIGDVAWRMIEAIRPARLITHRFPVEKAAEAYRLLDERPEEALQIVFTY